MELETSDLIVTWLGGGFVLVLAWAGTVGQALLTPGRGVRAATAVMAVVGLVSPVGAIAAFDIVRLDRTMGDPEPTFPRWALPASQAVIVLSLVIAAWAWTMSGSS